MTTSQPWERVNNLPDDDAPSRDVSVNSLSELRTELATADVARAIAAGWGFSHAGCTKGTRLRMLSFSGVTEPDDLLPGVTSRPFDVDPAVPSESPGPLRRVGAGTSFADLNAALHPWTVINQPGFGDLTFGGVMMVGGHGSGLNRGNIASQVRSMDLLTMPERGVTKLVRLEPEPVSDPVAFARQYGSDPRTAELKVDRALFNAAKVSFGTMGVLVSAVIDTRPSYRLHEDRDVRDLWEDWDKIERQVRDPAVAGVHLWVNPYRVGSDYKALQSTYRRSLDMKRNERGWGIRDADAPFTRLITRGLAKELPIIFPFALEFSFGALAADGVVMPSPEALDFGPPNKMQVSAASCSFPAEGLKDTLTALLEHFKETFPRNLVSSLIGIRWVKESDAPLAPQHGRDSVMIEVPVLNDTQNQQETLQKYVEFAVKLGARPHWGQRFWLTPQTLRSIYGQAQVEAFIAARRTLDPLRVFDNALTRQLEL